MWAITHVPTGTLVPDYNGSLFYSEQEARNFLLKTKRLLKRLSTIYYFDDTFEIRASRQYYPMFCLGAKPFGKTNFCKFRFYCNQKRHDACEEQTRQMINHYAEKLQLIPGNKVTAFYHQIKQAHLYFTIHRVN
jgi:hypothetical protein